MRTALVIEWNGQGKATLSGIDNPFILIDPCLLKVLGIEQPGTYRLSEARISMGDDSIEPWPGTLEYQAQKFELAAHYTSSFMGKETYTLRLAEVPCSTGPGAFA